jgi:hypothetical protein
MRLLPKVIHCETPYMPALSRAPSICCAEERHCMQSTVLAAHGYGHGHGHFRWTR